jgi:hypothetical protein
MESPRYDPSIVWINTPWKATGVECSSSKDEYGKWRGRERTRACSLDLLLLRRLPTRLPPDDSH